MAARKNVKRTPVKNKGDQKIFTCSKIILLVSYLIGVALTVVTIFGAFKGYDVSTIGIVTSAAYAEIAASNAFYYNKAKKENALKIALSAVEKYSADKVEDITKIVNSLGGII